MAEGLRISDGMTLPRDAVVETFGVLGKRGSGKSNGAVVLAEEMYDAGLPWVAVDPKGDWWGIRSSADGKGPGLAIPVFGGKHGDIPLEPTGGELLAKIVVADRLTCVVDCSMMSQGGRDRFLADFGAHLYTLNEDPLHVFLDEAHDYIPQQVPKSRTAVVGAWTQLVTQGRFRGLGITAISQRPARIHNDVLTQVETLLVYRTPGAPDIEAVRRWVKYQAIGEELLGSLSSLPNGECWLWSPQWLEKIERVQFRRRRTFDSGATPKMGAARVEPKKIADVDVVGITHQMAATIERTKADDPKTLRAEIAALKRALAAAEKAKPEARVETIEVPVVSDEAVMQLARAHEGFVTFCGRLDALAGEVRPHAEQLTEALRTITEAAHIALAPPTPPTRPPAVERPKVPRPSPHRLVAESSDEPITGGAMRMLAACAQYPGGLTRAQMGTLADVKRTGGTFTTYLGRLKRAALLVEEGGRCYATDAGMAEANVDAVPSDPAAVLDHWRSKFGNSGARRMLDIVADAGSSGLSRDELADRAEITGSGGTFTTYLGRLRTNGLIEEDSGRVRLAEWLVA